MGTSLWSPSLAEVAPEIGILIEEDVKLLKKHYNSYSELSNLKTSHYGTQVSVK